MSHGYVPKLEIDNLDWRCLSLNYCICVVYFLVLLARFPRINTCCSSSPDRDQKRILGIVGVEFLWATCPSCIPNENTKWRSPKLHWRISVLIVLAWAALHVFMIVVFSQSDDVWVMRPGDRGSGFSSQPLYGMQPATSPVSLHQKWFFRLELPRRSALKLGSYGNCMTGKWWLFARSCRSSSPTVWSIIIHSCVFYWPWVSRCTGIASSGDGRLCRRICGVFLQDVDRLNGYLCFVTCWVCYISLTCLLQWLLTYIAYVPYSLRMFWRHVVWIKTLTVIVAVITLSVFSGCVSCSSKVRGPRSCGRLHAIRFLSIFLCTMLFCFVTWSMWLDRNCRH